jgi:hypothetical protein
MFKKSKSVQINLFSSPSSLFSGKSQKIYDNNEGWHNKFRDVVTLKIDESIFKPLFSSTNGTPNASIRVLIAMMILKEAEGTSDQKLFENCRFNMLTRSAIGLLNADDSLPTESTYYLFRKKIVEHVNAGNENLFDLAFSQVTKNQSIEFEVSGLSVRMDSKLLGSNIARLSRYELVHETFRLFYNEVKQLGNLSEEVNSELDKLLKLEGNKVVYTHTSDEVFSRLSQLGTLINNVLPLFSKLDSPYYTILKTVFEQQYDIDDQGMVRPKENAKITAQSIQSPHDTDCTFRNKDSNKVKGYSLNITESCDDTGLNLIGNVEVRVASSSDVDFLKDGILKTQEVFSAKTEAIHADGAYHSVENQDFCNEKSIELYLHAIQGAKGRYKLDIVDNKLSVFDTQENKAIDYQELKTKEGVTKWRISTEKGYRYFTQENIDTALVRKKIEDTPIEVLQKRNNVEATIFQLGYHYSNAKSRYRGLIKHQMWANMRCLWLNFVRIINHNKEVLLKYKSTDIEFCLLDFKTTILAFLAIINIKSSTNVFIFENN